MANVSRECIRDTLLAKRECRDLLNGFVRQVYNLGIRNLRSDQLAPYIEKKMRANRYLDMQVLKRAAPEIVVVVRGGLVREVRSTNPYTTVYIANYDISCDYPEEDVRLSDAEERGNQSDMNLVYQNANIIS